MSMGTPPPQSSNSRAVEEKSPRLHCRTQTTVWRTQDLFRGCRHAIWNGISAFVDLCCPVSLTSGFASTQKREVSRQLAPVKRKISWPSTAVQKWYQELPVARQHCHRSVNLRIGHTSLWYSMTCFSGS